MVVEPISKPITYSIYIPPQKDLIDRHFLIGHILKTIVKITIRHLFLTICHLLYYILYDFSLYKFSLLSKISLNNPDMYTIHYYFDTNKK